MDERDLVVVSFHKVLLQGDGVTDVDVALDLVCWQELKFRVELGHSVLREQEQQVQAKQLVLESRLG